MDEEDSLLLEAASSASRVLGLDDRPRTAPSQSRLILPRDTKELMAPNEAVDSELLSHYVAQMHLNHGRDSISAISRGPWNSSHSRNGSDQVISEVQEALERTARSFGPSAFSGAVSSLRTGSDFALPSNTRSLNSALPPGFAATLLAAQRDSGRHESPEGMSRSVSRSLNSSMQPKSSASFLAANIYSAMQEELTVPADGWSSPSQGNRVASMSQQLNKLFDQPPASSLHGSFNNSRAASNASSIWADPPPNSGSLIPPSSGSLILPNPAVNPRSPIARTSAGNASVKQRTSEASKLRISSIANQTKHQSHDGDQSSNFLHDDPGPTSDSYVQPHYSYTNQAHAYPAPMDQTAYDNVAHQEALLNLALQQAYMGIPPNPYSHLSPPQSFYNPYTGLQVLPLSPPYDPAAYSYMSMQGGPMYPNGAFPPPASPPPPPPPGMNSGYPASSSSSARKHMQRRYEDDPVRGGGGPIRGGNVDPFLEDFKQQGCPSNLSLFQISGHTFEFARDQYGSRHLQLKLDTCSAEEVCAVVDELLPSSTGEEETLSNSPRILQLITDVFGNYVVQKLLERGLPEHKARIANALKGNVLNMSLQMYGCRVVQKCFEVLPLTARLDLLAEIDSQVMRCVQDSNGNHVVQKVIETLPTEKVAHILDKFITCVLALCLHPYGCRVMQRVLEHCRDEQRRAAFMDVILKSICQLAEDQYGNYVAQHVVEKGIASERHQVILALEPRIIQMSQHKFASNVVEKCLVYGSVAERDFLVQSMLGKGSSSEAPAPSDGQDPFQKMMLDQFGNYVVQKVLEVCDDTQRNLVMAHVRTQTEALKKQAYGKHIVARIEKLLATGMKLSAGALPIPSDSEINQRLEQMHQRGSG